MNWYLLRCKEGKGFVAKRIFNRVYFFELAIYGSVLIEEFHNQNVERIISREFLI